MPVLTSTRIVLAKPRGFCAGVNRAIDIVDLALEKYGAPLYVRHEIVHNHHVVNDFKQRGVIFVETLEEVPDNATLIFSAHGTSPAVIDAARVRGLNFIDAVCPLVTKVHNEISRAIAAGKQVIYIGHRGHQEVLGAMGYAPVIARSEATKQTTTSDGLLRFARNDGQRDDGTKTGINEQFKPQQNIYLVETIADVEKLAEILHDEKLVVATQTTLSLDDTAAIVTKLKESFSNIEFPHSDDICYATQNRQDAVKELVLGCDHILIIGSNNSSNTLRLLELAKKSGVSAELVPNPNEYEPSLQLQGKTIGISSGASAPESLVETLVAKLSAALGETQIETLNHKEEKITFPLPQGLR